MTKRTASARIADARGRRVTQLDPVAMHLLRRHDVIDAGTLRAIAEEIGPATSRATIRWFWAFQILPILCLPFFFVWVFFIKGARDPVGSGSGASAPAPGVSGSTGFVTPCCITAAARTAATA